MHLKYYAQPRQGQTQAGQAMRALYIIELLISRAELPSLAGTKKNSVTTFCFQRGPLLVLWLTTKS